MSVGTYQEPKDKVLYFITFSCYEWLDLIEITNTYDMVYKWFDYLHIRQARIMGYVIMPNHIHMLLYFHTMSKSINVIVANGKRFLAYEIIKRLKDSGNDEMLKLLSIEVSTREFKKGQKHKVFNESFDAKECYSYWFALQKLNYIHNNPVKGKWQLASDFTKYKHSSAGFYEGEEGGYGKLVDVRMAFF